MEAIGQQFDGAQRVVLEERQEDRTLTYRERQVLRADRLKPTQSEAARRLREAEDALDSARDALGTVATNHLLDEATEEQVREVEDAIADAERELRRWRAAVGALDAERGVIRDSFGNRLS